MQPQPAPNRRDSYLLHICDGCSVSEPPVATGQASTSNPAGVSASASASAPSSYPPGTKVTVPVTIEGIASVEVGAFYPHVTSSGQYDVSPTTGTTWAAIDATECAGTSGSSTGANSSDFSLLLSNGSTAQITFAEGPLKPSQLAALNSLGGSNTSLAAGQCDRGWVLFAVPNGTTPTFIQFSGTTIAADNAAIKNENAGAIGSAQLLNGLNAQIADRRTFDTAVRALDATGFAARRV